MSVSRILPKLKIYAQKRPLLFNSVIYGSFYTGAEFAQQTYNKVFKVKRIKEINIQGKEVTAKDCNDSSNRSIVVILVVDTVVNGTRKY